MTAVILAAVEINEESHGYALPEECESSTSRVHALSKECDVRYVDWRLILRSLVKDARGGHVPTLNFQRISPPGPRRCGNARAEAAITRQPVAADGARDFRRKSTSLRV